MKIVRLFDIHWDKNSEPPKERVIIANDDWRPQDAAVLLLKEFKCRIAGVVHHRSRMIFYALVMLFV